jgi:simple sugar transport system ATP-binding protein
VPARVVESIGNPVAPMVDLADAMTAETVLELHDIHKSYGSVNVLRAVNLTLQLAEVRALAGENGSGKSTLIKILSGVVAQDRGTISLFGRSLDVSSVSKAISGGLSVIYQDFALFPNLSVVENISFLKAIASGDHLNHFRKRRRSAAATLEQMGVQLDLDRRLDELPVASRQLVAIARALNNEARIIVMDEPTTALTRHEVVRLFAIIQTLKRTGTSFIFVSHKIEEIFGLCDSITVLRDGKVVAEGSAGEFSRERLVEAMTGRRIEVRKRSGKQARMASPFLSLRKLGFANNYHNVNLDLFAGEVVSIVGLLGSGRSELALTLFGLLPNQEGEIRIENRLVKLRSPSEAQSVGIAYVPEDRLTEGLFGNQPIRDNIVVSTLDEDALLGWLSPRRISARASRAVRRLAIRARSIMAPTTSLSGGNQQRVVLARWLEKRPKLMVLNGPTVGVDVGSKHDIHQLLLDLTRAGTAILIVTDDLSEAVGVSDRILVMVRGKIIAEHAGADVTEQDIYAEVVREERQ